MSLQHVSRWAGEGGGVEKTCSIFAVSVYERITICGGYIKGVPFGQ